MIDAGLIGIQARWLPAITIEAALGFLPVPGLLGFNFIVKRKREERVMIICHALGWLLLPGTLREVSAV